jgi:hypothetical protein
MPNSSKLIDDSTKHIVEYLASMSVKQITGVAHLLVKTEPKVAETIEFLIGVELQEKTRNAN